eukprot:635881-Amorphochlora_amoeboformis.AAC.1
MKRGHLKHLWAIPMVCTAAPVASHTQLRFNDWMIGFNDWMIGSLDDRMLDDRMLDDRMIG